SEQQRAPVIVIKPATAQAPTNQPGAPVSRADSAEVMKIPEPIIEPTTIMVASSGPRPRTSLPRSTCASPFMAVERAPRSLPPRVRGDPATGAQTPPLAGC